MKIPFLRNLPGLGGPPVRQVSPGSGPYANALHQLLTELPDLLLSAVFDIGSGQPLATYAAERHYQPALLAAPVVAAVRQLLAGQASQPALAGEQLQEVLLTLPTQLHLARLRPGSQHLLYLAVDARDTNLALARELTQQAMNQLAQST